MKRLGAAIACALVLHAGLFWIGSGRFMSTTVAPSIPRPVTVTLSYRHAPGPAAIKNKETVKPPDIPAPDKPKAPARLPRTTALPHVVRPEAHNAAAQAQKEEVRAAGKATDSDNARVSKVSAKERSGEGALERTAVPLYKLNPPPRYPAAARRRGQQGMVVLSVHVDEYGRVSNLWLFESSGYQALDNAAVQAVKDWTFEPGMQGGRNVAMWVTVPVRFELK